MYRWVEHTGELELELDAPDERGVFQAAFDAMRELLDCDRLGAAPARRIELSSTDRTTLLADWLAELAYLAEAEGLVPQRLAELELNDAGLEALVEGFRGQPPHLVKGVTYHRLALERTDTGWRGRVVLDV